MIIVVLLIMSKGKPLTFSLYLKCEFQSFGESFIADAVGMGVGEVSVDECHLHTGVECLSLVGGPSAFVEILICNN